jgi:predicted lipid-binding transport protein (Tim44 family)
LAAFLAAGLRFAAFFAGAFFATAFFLATLRLAGALRAVVFLAATVPPRGKTLGRPEGSCLQGWQTKAHFVAFFANKVARVSQHEFWKILEKVLRIWTFVTSQFMNFLTVNI